MLLLDLFSTIELWYILYTTTPSMGDLKTIRIVAGLSVFIYPARTIPQHIIVDMIDWPRKDLGDGIVEVVAPGGRMPPGLEF